ncbi:MAG: hypothetical protein IKU88_05945 [Alistipes sp.]|nr:hypothetical protein [Alistipes sp.]
MIKKIIYVIGWSLGLLFATFPNLFEGNMNFEMSDLPMKDIYKPYLFPLIMALSLFVSDVCYVFEQEKSTNCSTPKYITEVLMLICVFLVGLTYSISSNDNSYIGFIVAWTALTIMKFLKTNKCVKNNKPAPISCVVITED